MKDSESGLNTDSNDKTTQRSEHFNISPLNEVKEKSWRKVFERCMTVLIYIVGIGIILTISMFMGVYIFQSQKCPFDIQTTSEDIPCNISEDNIDINGTAIINKDKNKTCDLFYKNYEETYALCIDKNWPNNIVEGFYCDHKYTVNQFCDEEDRLGGFVIVTTVIGLIYLSIDLSVLAFSIFFVFYPLFIPSGHIVNCIQKAKKIEKEYEKYVTWVIKIIFFVMLFTFGSLVFVNLLPIALNGTKDLGADNGDKFQCQIYQKCVGEASNCFDANKYCYTPEFIWLHVAIVGMFGVSFLLVHIAFYSSVAILFGIFSIFQWILTGNSFWNK